MTASSTIDREIEARLGAAGVRYTRARRAVVGALARVDGPRSASELHEEMERGVPLSSLYRSLSVLDEAGVLEPHNSLKGLTRYELAEWLAGHHHHLVCLSCGTVEDIQLSAEIEARLEQLVETVTDEMSFSASGHTLEVHGRCARCV
ncbi:MAG: transcriptional repressor [Actinomycetota bacterium]|nr:transcriptional repressor [Actinomycetota bacterium]